MSGIGIALGLTVVLAVAGVVALVVKTIRWDSLVVGFAIRRVSRRVDDLLPESRQQRPPADERGVAVLELVLLVPVFLMLVFFGVAMGRLGQAREDIDAVARDAARAGSIARSADDAQTAATTTASDVLASHGLTCAGLAVNVDTADFRPGGWVRVDVSCTISVADLAGIWAPGDKTMQARGLAVVDAFRRTD